MLESPEFRWGFIRKPENLLKYQKVWKRFIQFEQTYGDLASILKVEQRRKEALSGKGEEGSSPLESSLQECIRILFAD